LNVLVVDDSAVVRQAISAILSQESDMSVTVAADAVIADGKIAKSRPDVIVLDIEMPRMDGLTFLRMLMARDPIPVVVCSGLTGTGAQHAMRALEEGAVSIVTKPKVGVREFLYESAVALVDAVRSAAQARLPVRRDLWPVPRPRLGPDVLLPKGRPGRPPADAATVIAIGASAGGTEALREVLQAFPADAPGPLVVQHMPEAFTAAFAARLDGLCEPEIREARAGDALLPGQVLLAPGNRHMLLRRSGNRYSVELSDGPLVSRHRPSVDVLFRSVAQAAGPQAVGAILTGMGADGALGLLEMRQAGARTIAQDEATCVVYGMPKEAVACGAVQSVLPLKDIASALLADAEEVGRPRPRGPH
jgi:two-component system chemotaxis response regulator CheB